MFAARRLIFGNIKSLNSLSKHPTKKLAINFSSSSGPKGGKNKQTPEDVVPNDFFDDAVESEKEFLDIATALAGKGGLENLTTVKDAISWNDVDGNTIEPAEIPATLKSRHNQVEVVAEAERLEESFEGTPAYNVITQAVSNEDLATHIQGFAPRTFIPESYMNYTVPWRKEQEFPHPMLDRFVPDTAREKFRHDEQGLRACAGKKQRQGKEGTLRCHVIDLDELDHMDVLTLRKFLSDDSEILGRKHTGLCAKCQRQVAKTIKRARNFGIVPHIGEYVIQDSRPLQRDGLYHDIISGKEKKESKTIA